MHNRLSNGLVVYMNKIYTYILFYSSPRDLFFILYFYIHIPSSINDYYIEYEIKYFVRDSSTLVNNVDYEKSSCGIIMCADIECL